MEKEVLDAVIDLIRTGVWSKQSLDPCEFGAINDAVNCARDEARREQREKDAKEIAHAIEFAVEWTIKQLSQKEDWPASWDAGFPSYKGGALFAYQAAAIESQED